MAQRLLTNNLGYPRIGTHRELKKATESYWKGKISKEELLQAAAQIRKQNWLKQKETGIDRIPSNDFSFYDQMLDMACLVGAVPSRYEWKGGDVNLDTYFAMARGVQEKELFSGGEQKTAMEMTKWFDTNYHYIVPEFEPNQKFAVSFQKPFDEFKEALDQGILTKPVLIGPISFLLLGKAKDASFNTLDLLDHLVPVYIEILTKLQSLGAERVQIDEPCLVKDLTKEQLAKYTEVYKKINEEVMQKTGLKILFTTYFGPLIENLEPVLNLPVTGFHFDMVRGESDLINIIEKFPKDKYLSLGVVNGRNIWKNDYLKSLAIIEKAVKKIGAEKIYVAPTCSLIHSPITLETEEKLDADLKNALAFAEEKLHEVVALAELAGGGGEKRTLEDNEKVLNAWRSSSKINNPEVKERVKNIQAKDAKRKSPFEARQKVQQNALGLPLFPTTTIGSFPQTKEVRANRRKLKKGEISQKEHDIFIENEIKKVIKLQEETDIDILVHGEFERNDMVEYFGEQLEGFAFTENAWVQSYGSRYVKPPIIFGDVSRPNPMTVAWSQFAQSLTRRPVKGMLTGPVTILQWSFVREDQPRSETTKQIALAIRDEVVDLESAGIKVIQIDEPAFREGLPIRQRDWEDYLNWAVESFRLSASGVKDETQIHTHMCYCEFNDIIESISDLDADVISIETSRSQMELLNAFSEFQYPKEVGPGVFDIHSPRIPDASEMKNLLKKAVEVLPVRNVWVNPDCGLKTRGYAEVEPQLKNMVEAAKGMRAELEAHSNS